MLMSLTKERVFNHSVMPNNNLYQSDNAKSNTTLLIITGRLQVGLQVKTLHFHILALPRNYIDK